MANFRDNRYTLSMHAPYRASLDALPAQICILDQEGTIIFVNESWRQFAIENDASTAEICEGANYLAT